MVPGSILALNLNLKNLKKVAFIGKQLLLYSYIKLEIIMLFT